MPTFVARHAPHLEITRRNAAAAAVHPREPGLINLPIPLPSIPILNPIITPLIQGNNNQPAPTTPATQPPATQDPPTPQPTNTGGSSGGSSGGGSGNGGSGGGSGNGNGDGNGGSGGGSGGSGNGQPTDNGGSSSPSPSSGGDNGGNGGNGGDTGGGDATGTSPTGTGTGNSPSSSSSGSPTSSNGGDFVSSNGNTPVNAGEDPSESDSGSGGSSSGGSDGKTGSSGGGTTKAGGSVPGATGMPTTTDADGGFGGNVGGGSGGGNGGSGIEGAGASQNHGLTKGAIAGIVVVVILAAIGVTVVLLRRRLRSRRTERRNNWFFSRNRTSQTYGDRAHGDLGISGGRAGSGGGSAGQRRSVRSSFETTVDHSVTPRLDMDFDIPALPPMAELRGTPMLVNLDSPVSPVNGVRAPEINITTTPQSRFSVGTVSSLSSDGQGQWLVVNRDNLAPEVGTPMSVRPFSPTESFAFPKPPTEKSSGDWGSQFSRPASAHTLNASFNSGVRSPSSHALGVGITEEEVPALPIPSPAANPFNDPDPIALHAAAVVALGVGQGTPTNIDVAAANKIQDPFADPTFPSEPLNPSPVHPEFMEIETIRRPFIPTLDDELGVELGDKVRIMQMFDDGWALVEKNPVYGKASVKGKGKQPEKGLIPIDCFRDHGLELSQFIASKRVSSYSQSSSKYTAGGAAF